MFVVVVFVVVVGSCKATLEICRSTFGQLRSQILAKTFPLSFILLASDCRDSGNRFLFSSFNCLHLLTFISLFEHPIGVHRCGVSLYWGEGALFTRKPIDYSWNAYLSDQERRQTSNLKQNRRRRSNLNLIVLYILFFISIRDELNLVWRRENENQTLSHSD